MSIQFHPEPGTILICDFKGLNAPEMTKRRPVIVISPRFKHRTKLCTVVPLSTTAPSKIEPYHHKLNITPPLPEPYDANHAWVKADMLYTVAFDRLFLPFAKKDTSGKREYDFRVIEKLDLIKVQECVLYGLGLTSLTS
jgi:uncharacterized protein YifN (PemK superfamily)